MDIQIIPTAEASITTLMQSIDRVVINPVIFFMFALAMAYFIYGVVQYLLNPSSEEVRKTSKSHMLWGIIGIFIMVAVFGIMRLILGTIGETHINVSDTGAIQVDHFDVSSGGGSAGGGIGDGTTGGGSGFPAGTSTVFSDINIIIANNTLSATVTTKDTGVILIAYDVAGTVVAGPQPTSVTDPSAVTNTDGTVTLKATLGISGIPKATDLATAPTYLLRLKGQTDAIYNPGGISFKNVNSSPNQSVSYTTSPFSKSYVSDSACWRGTVYGKSDSELNANNLAIVAKRDKYLADTHKASTDVPASLPVTLETKTLPDTINKLFYVWIAAAGPIGSGNCPEISQQGNEGILLAQIKSESNLDVAGTQEQKDAIATVRASYVTDSSYYRQIDSGVASDVTTAEATALKNAKLRIGIQKDISDISTLNTSKLYGRFFFVNGSYHYWIAISSPK